MPFSPNIPDWINAVIATLALVRPWQFFKRPKLDVVLGENLGLSFNPSGARLMLRTTLRATNADLFVTRAEVVVTHQKTKATTRLAWIQNATNTVDYQGNIQYAYMEATGFVVTNGLGMPFQPVFNQRDISSHATEQLDKLNKAWSEFVKSAEYSTIAEKVQGQSEQREEQMLSFRAQYPVRLDAYNAFDQEFIWREGKYDLALHLRTAEEKEFSATGTFALTREQAEYLRVTVVQIVDSATGLSSPYRWVTVQLDDNAFPRA